LCLKKQFIIHCNEFIQKAKYCYLKLTVFNRDTKCNSIPFFHLKFYASRLLGRFEELPALGDVCAINRLS
ncbi:MAG TPA: hypothetical protein VGB71_07100, partial [Flavisolibacter sp.]